MPEQENIAKAVLQEIGWTDNWEPKEVDSGKELTVQFNPQTLKVAFTNSMSGGDQRGGAAIQYVGKGATKLNLDLLFDVTAPLADGSMQPDQDVRVLTRDVAYFLMPQEEAEEGKFVPPGIRFIWGSFIFEGVLESMNETLELFSSQGKPLRATVGLSLTRQDIFFPEVSGAGGAGTTPQTTAQEGDTAQSLAGDPDNWKSMAEANDVENPRNIPVGTLLS